MGSVHPRQQIKALVVTAVTGLTTTGTDVFTDPLHPIALIDLPAVRVVVTRDEVLADDNAMGGIETREISVTIEAVEEAATGLAATLDLICLEVEAAVFNDAPLAALAFDGGLRSTEIDLTGDGEAPIGTATMDWFFVYQINISDPSTIL